jgi:four helix bundle protein
MIDVSVQNTVKVPENSVNQLAQEVESLKQRILEIEKLIPKENINEKFFIVSFALLSLILIIFILYLNYRLNIKIKKIAESQEKDKINIPNPSRNDNLIEEFIKGVLNLASKIPQTPVNEPIVNQLVKTVTSMGAILIWTENPESKRDFQYKINICQKKVQETEYWLKIIILVAPELKNEIAKMLAECQAIKNFLNSIINQ